MLFMRNKDAKLHKFWLAAEKQVGVKSILFTQPDIESQVSRKVILYWFCMLGPLKTLYIDS